VLAPTAGELIQELTLAIRQRLRLRDLATLVHVYPTVATSVDLLGADVAYARARQLPRRLRFGPSAGSEGRGRLRAMADLMEGEQLIWRGRPSWRAMIAYYLRWGSLALVAVVVLAIIRAVSDVSWPLWPGLVITLVALAIVVLIGWIMRIATLYTVTDHRIIVRRGIIARNEKSAHIDRIQNVNYSQTPWQRLLNVGNVDFDTAGSDSSELTLRGVNDPRGLREVIAGVYGERIRESDHARR
jgi:membrane protein YdbS with pleckstrin-like domain